METNSHQRSAWLIVFVLLLTSAAAPLNQFKVPPIMPLLMDAFRLSVGSAGLLMSVFAVTGIILALPAGFIFQKLGYRVTGLLAVGAVASGAAIGALSLSPGTMLASRVIEGVGTSLVAVVAPAVIALWFAADKRGAPMGVWAIWVPLDSTAMLVVAPPLAGRLGWQGVWWFGSLYAVIVGVLFLLVVRPAPGPPASSERVTRNDLLRVLRNRDLWLASFVFCCFNTAFIGFVTWAPTFLNSTRGMSLAQASSLISLVPMLNFVSCPLCGWVSDRIGSRKLVIVVPMILMAVLWPLAFVVKDTGFVALAIAVGFVSGFTPTGLFSAGMEVVGDERLGGMAMAVIQVGLNAGMLLGPLMLGLLIGSAGGWALAFGALIPVCLAGAVAGWLARVR